MAKSQHVLGYRPVMRLLREMREEAGMTQREMAAKVRKPQPWVHKSEVGERRLDINEFYLWATACNVRPEEAFERFVRLRR
ncbi:MAG TPA: helix-turn-helix transcriptional regulator [Tepidisphaeraceae bacterium]|nr:helix-turn-helix transcriptional regulator [Tepidisphaeraceae bacterium]